MLKPWHSQGAGDRHKSGPIQEGILEGRGGWGLHLEDSVRPGEVGSQTDLIWCPSLDLQHSDGTTLGQKCH